MPGKDMFTQCVIQSVSRYWPVGRWPPMSVPPDTLDEVCDLMGSLANSMEEDVFGCQRAGADYDLTCNTLFFYVESEDISFTGEDHRTLLRLSELASSIHFVRGEGGGSAVMSVVFDRVFELEVSAGE